MPTLLDGTVIDESHDAYHFFTPQECKQFYGMERVVEYITIHHWGLKGQDFDQVVNFLCSRRDFNPTSAHAVIMGGRASSIVNPDNAAFHAGSARGNARSVGLECRPEATDEDYVTVAAYVLYLRSIYGNVPLRKHSDWYATACPGDWDLGRIESTCARLVNEDIKVVLDSAPVNTPAPAPAPMPVYDPNNGHNPDTEIHWVVERGDTMSKIADYYYGEHSPATIQKLAAYNNIANPNNIRVGQNIFIPGPVVWTVEAPDELVTIAAYYGMDPDVLAHNNGLPDRNAEIFVGWNLRII